MPNIVNIARRTLEIEAEALRRLAQSVDNAFVDCATAIHQSGGRLIVTGVGKTALVAQKIVATLNSTGTPALFLHAADALHGDIGMVQPDDVVLVISRSGETAEIDALTLVVRRLGNTIVGMCSRRDSTLARRADYLLHTPFEREADPNELAPTTSTTLQMAMGDALAMVLLSLRGFSPRDFARFHPGGSLGKRLYLRVSDVYPKNTRPMVYTDTPLKEVLYEISGKCLGATVVVGRGTRVQGIITDGDVRRMLNDSFNLTGITAADMMSPHPKTIGAEDLAVRAVEILQQHSITQLIVAEEDGRYLGMVHLHDFVREGIL